MVFANPTLVTYHRDMRSCMGMLATGMAPLVLDLITSGEVSPDAVVGGRSVIRHASACPGEGQGLDLVSGLCYARSRFAYSSLYRRSDRRGMELHASVYLRNEIMGMVGSGYGRVLFYASDFRTCS
jgi:hypothetical protein